MNPKMTVSFLTAAFAAVGLAARAETPDSFVDYVEATGQQWVDTGVVGRYDTKVELQAEWLDLGTDSALLACRGDDGTADNWTRVNFCNSSWGVIGYGYGYYEHIFGAFGDGSLHECRWELDRTYTVTAEFAKTGDGATSVKVVVDGVSIMDRTTNALVQAGQNLYLFANNVNGTATGLAAARCYGLKIWQKPLAGGEYALVRDLRPCLKDGRAGLHDAVTGDILRSGDGTDLAAGPDVNTPDRFIPYVESTGGEYIDLEVVGRSGVEMEADMSWTEVPNDGSFVAARNGNNTRYYLYHNYGSQTFGYGNYFQSGKTTAAGKRQTVHTVLKDGEQTMTVDGAAVLSRKDTGVIDTKLNLYLFACNKENVPQYAVKARCYGLKLWEDGTLVRDFRPCLKRGRGALYDQLSGRIFHAGKGTLRFAAPDPVPGKPDYFVDCIEARGETWFDSGVRARSGTRVAGDFALLHTRFVEEERIVYIEGPYLREERSIVGACAADGGRRFYPLHFPNGTLWLGYNDFRTYPTYLVTNYVTTVTTNEEGGVQIVTTNVTEKVVETRFSLGTDRHTVDTILARGLQTMAYDGKTVFTTNLTDEVDAGGNLYVFACNRAGQVYYRASARLYSLKIWQTPEIGGDYALVRAYWPCVKDGQGALYDAVRDEVVFPALPIPLSHCGLPIYTEDLKPKKVLDFVESNGTQWFDTGVTGRVDTVAEFEMSWLKRVDDPDDGFLGSRANGGDTRFYLWHDAHNSHSFGYGGFAYFNATDVTNPNYRDDPNHIPVVNGERHRVRVSFAADRQMTEMDGKTLLDIARPDCIDTGYPMYLFAYNNYGAPACKCAARCHWLKIWQDGKIVRRFIPVELDNGLPALFDKVEKKVYPPKGGLIVPGPVIDDYEDNRATLIIVR